QSRVCLLYSVSFSRIIALSGDALALTAQLVYCTSARLSIPFSHFFTHFLVFVFFASIGPKKRGEGSPFSLLLSR
ncbi:MAG: hypothetical protein ACI4MU_02990, partial [Candidatus Ventricola sp.]